MGNAEELLAEHKKVSLITGNLSDFQIKNMKMYPLVAFDSVTEVSLDYNIRLKLQLQDSYVHYKITTSKTKEQYDNLDKRINAIKSWIKHLLWSEVDVIIELNGEKI